MHFGRFCGKVVCICEMLHVRRKIEKKRLHLLRGSLHMCRGSSFGLPEFCALWCALCELWFVSAVLSRCPFFRGSRLSLASDRVFRLFFGFGSLVGGLCSWLFSFPFSLCWLLWVLSMPSSRRRLRTRCIRRLVEGRSLVMSD